MGAERTAQAAKKDQEQEDADACQDPVPPERSMISSVAVNMDIDRFNRGIIEIQEKLFDAEMQVTRLAIDLLGSCGGRISLNIEIPYLSISTGYRTFIVETFFFDEDLNRLAVAENSGLVAAWDEIDIQSKELIVNETYMLLTSDRIFNRLAEKEDIN